MGRPVGAQDGAGTSEAWRAAHRRLYEHLCSSTQEGDQPTLEALQPLYQAVAHGCQAGLQQEACDKVYFARILRGQEGYSAHKLGAFGSDLGAAACFFEPPWSRVSPALTEADQAWLLNNAAFYLRGVGRLTEALEPMRAGLPIEVKREDWKNAAIRASNLSELELALGEVAGAVGDAEQSVTDADRSGDAGLRMIMRTTHADALHQAGRRAEAEARFREAEQMWAKTYPNSPLMCSTAGFRYCDLLLAEAERAAWQTLLGRDGPLGRPRSSQHDDPTNEELVESCHAVSQRAAQTLKWVTEAKLGLLDIALDHLTLGRAVLYEFILGGRGSTRAPNSSPASRDFTAGVEAGPPETARRELASAVSGLRRAGQAQELPRGLLTRAWLRFLTGPRTGPDSAQSDLDEAWEIAERGPMKLFLADIHLYRARLFGVSGLGSGVPGGASGETKYPWESPAADLAAAEKIILHETTYKKPDGQVIRARFARRDQELADAKQAILGM